MAATNSSLLKRIGASRPRATEAVLVAVALLWVGCPSPATPEDAASTSLDAARADDDAFETPVEDVGPRADGGAREDAASADDAAIDAQALGDASADARASTDTHACTSISEEVCNGVDDTCDGAVDEGCACSPLPLVATSDGFHVALARTSAGEIVTAHQELGVGYAVERHGAGLAPIGDTIELVTDDTRPSSDLALFAMGADVGALWRQWPSPSMAADEPMFARIDAASATRAVGPLSLAPGLGGTLGHSGTAFGSGFAIARAEAMPLGSGIGVRLFDRAGEATFGPTPLLEDRSVGYTAIAPIGDTLGVAYQANTGSDPIEIRFVRFDDAAVPVGSSIALGAGVRPHVASQSSGWGVIWEGSSGVMFATVGSSGTAGLAPRMIATGSARGASITSDGTGGWAIVHRTGEGTRFVHLDATGATVGEAISPSGFYVDGIDVLALDEERFVTVGLIAGGGSAFWVPCTLR